MAEFHEYAYITQYMTMLRTEGDLATLKDAIPSSTEWGTSHLYRYYDSSMDIKSCVPL